MIFLSIEIQLMRNTWPCSLIPASYIYLFPLFGSDAGEEELDNFLVVMPSYRINQVTQRASSDEDQRYLHTMSSLQNPYHRLCHDSIPVP
jgi:hypothetical protein